LSLSIFGQSRSLFKVGKVMIKSKVVCLNFKGNILWCIFLDSSDKRTSLLHCVINQSNINGQGLYKHLSLLHFDTKRGLSHSRWCYQSKVSEAAFLNKFYKEKKAIAFNLDRCFLLALCLCLILFHYQIGITML
jgi:hypothetical protein